MYFGYYADGIHLLSCVSAFLTISGVMYLRIRSYTTSIESISSAHPRIGWLRADMISKSNKTVPHRLLLYLLMLSYRPLIHNKVTEAFLQLTSLLFYKKRQDCSTVVGYSSHSIYFNSLVTPFNISLPILRSKPCLVIGTPVARAISCFTLDMPTARFHENVSPGIFIFHDIYTQLNYHIFLKTSRKLQ